jgi:hypothetical protein
MLDVQGRLEAPLNWQRPSGKGPDLAVIDAAIEVLFLVSCSSCVENWHLEVSGGSREVQHMVRVFLDGGKCHFTDKHYPFSVLRSSRVGGTGWV